MKNTFTIPIIPSNDAERLQALRRYEILGTPPEGAFNKIAELAVKIFRVPIALVSLVDKEEVFFKANVGMEGVTHTSRGMSLCSLAILHNKPTIFEDTTNEPCLVANPLVAGSFGLKFYAGVPIVTHDGYNIGTVCIVDKKPRKFTERDQAMLQDLASIVMEEMEIRIAAIKAARAKNEIMHIAAHDLKNPLFGIQSLSDLIKRRESPEQLNLMTDMIKGATAKMISLIDKLIKLSAIEDNQIALELNLIDPASLAADIINSNQLRASEKNQKINLTAEVTALAYVDKAWLCDIIDNLVGNAVKYSPKGKSIDVYVRSDDDGLYMEVKDEGLGFTEKDLAKAFGKFAKLSAIPTDGETSNGLGLSIVKTLVELHKGTISIKSDGIDKGSTITVKIPNLLTLQEAQKH